MAIVYPPLVKEITTTTGNSTPYHFTGTIFPGGYQTLGDAIADGDTVAYRCTMGNDWEIGYGQLTYDGGAQDLTRNVKYSSNANAAVNWGSGEKTVVVIEPIDLFVAINHGNPTGYTGIPNTNGGSNSIIIGEANTNNSDYAYVIGRDNFLDEQNVLSKSNSFVMGNSNIVNGNNSLAFGIFTLIARDAMIAYSTGARTYGQTQVAVSTPHVFTVDATETLFSSEDAAFQLRPASLLDLTTIFFTARIVARQTAGSAGTVGDSKAWEMKFVLSYNSTVLTQIGTTTKTVIAASAGASAWDVDIDLTGSGSLTATGETDKEIKFTAYVNAVECSYGVFGE